MPINALANSPATRDKDISILVPSCDKYSDLWAPFAQLLFKYWPELNSKNSDIPIYLTSNQTQFNHPRIKNILLAQDNNWSDSIRAALQQIQTKYVLILLEDYLLKQSVADADFWAAFHIMQKVDAAYLQVADGVTGIDQSFEYPHHIMRKGQYAELRNNLYAAIWDREILLSLLKSGENAWEFEHAGNLRSQDINRHFLAVVQNQPIAYHNAVQARVFNTKVLYYLKFFEGIDLTDQPLKLQRDSWLNHMTQDLFGINFFNLLFPTMVFALVAFGLRRSNNAGVWIFSSLAISVLTLHYYLPLTRFILSHKYSLLTVATCGILLDVVMRHKNNQYLTKPGLTFSFIVTYFIVAGIAAIYGIEPLIAICLALLPMIAGCWFVQCRNPRVSLGYTGVFLLIGILILLAINDDKYFANIGSSLLVTILIPGLFYASNNSSLLKRLSSSMIQKSA